MAWQIVVRSFCTLPGNRMYVRVRVFSTGIYSSKKNVRNNANEYRISAQQSRKTAVTREFLLVAGRPQVDTDKTHAFIRGSC